MAKYSKLLLQNGGGIKFTEQMVPLEPNTASIFIGLGGTGMDCLRKIKTEVQQRIYPEDYNATTYQNRHIRFLGIDSTFYKKRQNVDGLLDLEETQFLDIGDADIKTRLMDPSSFEERPDLQWFEHEKVTMSEFAQGSGGIRQIGRLLFMEKSDLFVRRLEHEIQTAKCGLSNPKIMIYIITGMGGGTGSGCFLDVCYLTQHVAKHLHSGAVIQSCVFLPDVNVAKLPEEAYLVQDMIYRNAYAAMQELDYCMGLPENGDSFQQTYRDGKAVDWNGPPVDVCYLVGSNGELGGTMRNGYHHAISTASEFMVESLITGSRSQMLANIYAIMHVANARKNTGAKIKYCAIGAAVIGAVPWREAHTYSAAKLMEKFSCIKQNAPMREDVDLLGKRAFDTLQKELQDGVSETYTDYQDDWKYVMNYGNAELVKHYTKQSASKVKQIEVNAKALMDKNAKTALVRKVKEALDEQIYDLEKGPFYVERMLDGAEIYNLTSYIDGLIHENQTRWNEESAKTKLRADDYQRAYSDFDGRTKRSFFDTDQKRFDEYMNSLVLLEQHKLNMFIYEKLNEVLVGVREQIKWESWNYYHKLCRVVSNLMETFSANIEYMQSEAFTYDSFVRPVVTVEEIAHKLNLQVDEMSHRGMFTHFMRQFTQMEEEWADEDEAKICNMISRFFTDCVLSPESFENMLREKYTSKYDGMSDPAISQMFFSEWIKPLAERARPFNSFNQAIVSENDVTRLETITCGDSTSILNDAVNLINQYGGLQQVNTGGRNNYISAICIAIGVPLVGYVHCRNAEIRKYIQEFPGQHIYERDGLNGRRFSDWRKLPPITPQCLLNEDDMQPKLREWLKEKKALFQTAKALKLIDEEGYLCQPTDEAIKQFKNLFYEYEDELRQMEIPAQMRYCDKIIAILRDAMNLETERTDYQLWKDQWNRSPEANLRIQEDYFVATPIFQLRVQDQIDEINTLFYEAEKLIAGLEERMEIFRV